MNKRMIMVFLCVIPWCGPTDRCDNCDAECWDTCKAQDSSCETHCAELCTIRCGVEIDG